MFIFSKNQLLDSLIFLYLFLRLYLIYFSSDLNYFPSSIHIGFVCCSFTNSFKCEVRLFIWTFFWDRPVMLWISLLRLYSQSCTDFGLLCPHFHLFQGTLWFLWFCCWPVHCLIARYFAFIFLCVIFSVFPVADF